MKKGKRVFWLLKVVLMFFNPLNKYLSVLELGRLTLLGLVSLGLALIFLYPSEWYLENIFDILGFIIAGVSSLLFFVAHKSLSYVDKKQDKILKRIAYGKKQDTLESTNRWGHPY